MSDNEHTLQNIDVLTITPQKFRVTFNDKDGNEIGRLEENDDGELVYNGKITEGGDIFFKAVVQANSLRIRELRELLKMGNEVVEDFMPNVGQCVLQDYGRLNDFLTKAKEEFGE
jgi:hypothetical protein